MGFTHGISAISIEKKTFAIQRWFWTRFGALAGVFWELWGISWGLSRASKPNQEGFQIHLGTILGLVCSLLAVKDGLGTVLSSSGASRNGFRAPKLTLLLSKMMALLREYQHFRRKKTSAIQRWFWKRFGPLSGFFGGPLGVPWGRFGAFRSIREGLQIRLGTLLGLVGSLLAAEDGFGSVLGLSLARFGCPRGPFRGCFGLRQTDFDHQSCFSELRNLILSCCCCCCCCPRFPLTLQLILDSARRNARSD